MSTKSLLYFFSDPKDMEYVNVDGRTPLMHAILYRDYTTATSLIKIGADWKKPMYNGFHTQNGMAFNGLSLIDVVKSYVEYETGLEKIYLGQLLQLLEKKKVEYEQHIKEIKVMLITDKTLVTYWVPRDIINEVFKFI